jgi:hypothetical protein
MTTQANLEMRMEYTQWRKEYVVYRLHVMGPGLQSRHAAGDRKACSIET